MGRLQVGLFLAVLVVLAYAQTEEESAKEQARQMLRSMAQKCKESEGATDDDVTAMIDDVMPESQVQKCFHSCVQQQFGVSDGAKFLKEGFLEIMMMVYSEDEQKQGYAKEVAEECDGVANEDRCQLAVDIMTCVRQGMDQRGMKMDR
uniref:Putative odorant-binding protein 56e n=1 Tax=Culex tarsalis TaxID=7177 RepID=A0A1Q3FRX2_CULTA